MKTIEQIKDQLKSEKLALDKMGYAFDAGDLSLAAYSIKREGIKGTIKALEWVIKDDD